MSGEERQKLEDFKEVFKQLSLYGDKKTKEEISKAVDLIFQNIEDYYLEFKEDIPYVSVEDEPYPYHILRPIDGKYFLLDFLINRAFSNINGIDFKEDESYFSTDKILHLKENPFPQHQETDDLKRQVKKCHLHTIGHALQAIDAQQDGFIHLGRWGNANLLSFEKRVQIIYKNLGTKYPTILRPSLFYHFKEQYTKDPFLPPFQEETFKEGISEMYACEFAGLYQQCRPIKISSKIRIQVPDPMNGYASFTRFFYHLRMLTNKKDLFYSTFCAGEDALLTFAEDFTEEIENVYQKSPLLQEKIKEVREEDFPLENAFQKLKATLLLACQDVWEHDSLLEASLIAQQALDKIFALAYVKKLKTSPSEKDILSKMEMAAYLSPDILEQGMWTPSAAKSLLLRTIGKQKISPNRAKLLQEYQSRLKVLEDTFQELGIEKEKIDSLMIFLNLAYLQEHQLLGFLLKEMNVTKILTDSEEVITTLQTYNDTHKEQIPMEVFLPYSSLEGQTAIIGYQRQLTNVLNPKTREEALSMLDGFTHSDSDISIDYEEVTKEGVVSHSIHKLELPLSSVLLMDLMTCASIQNHPVTYGEVGKRIQNTLCYEKNSSLPRAYQLEGAANEAAIPIIRQKTRQKEKK